MTLSLDLGTTTGFAVGDGPTILDSGVWELPTRATFDPKDSNIDRRPAYLAWRVAGVVLDGGVTAIAYEDVNPSTFKSKQAATVYLGLRGALHSAASTTNLPLHPYPVGTVKRHLAGRGNATKEQMLQAAALKFPKIDILDDNHADALGVYCTHYKI